MVIRKRDFLIFGAAALTTSCTFIEQPPITYPTTTPPEALTAERAAEAINLVRAAYDSPPVYFDDLLSEAAAAQARNMAARNEISHNLGPGFTLRERIEEVDFQGYVGENLARGHTTLEAALEGWLESTSHRETLLRTDYELFGLAAARATVGKRDVYWSLLMGTVSDRSAR